MTESFSSTRPKFWASAISNISNPAVLVLVSVIAITQTYAGADERRWNYAIIGSFLLLGPGLLYSVYLWIKERQVDFDITRREDRVVPLMLVTLGALVGGYLIETRIDNQTLIVMSRTLVAMLMALTIITLVWKVSLHAATLTALVSLLVVYQHWAAGFLYLLIFPIGWARMELRQHTINQIIAGALTGVLITFGAVLLFH